MCNNMIYGIAPAFNLVNRIDQDILCNTKTGKRTIDTPRLTVAASSRTERSILNNQQINVRIFMTLTASRRPKKHNSHRIDLFNDALGHLIDY